jgi:hypothetical protein
MSTEAGIQLIHHPMELKKKRTGLDGTVLLLEYLHCHDLYISVQPKPMAHLFFLEKDEHIKVSRQQV